MRKPNAEMKRKRDERDSPHIELIALIAVTLLFGLMIGNFAPTLF